MIRMVKGAEYHTSISPFVFLLKHDSVVIAWTTSLNIVYELGDIYCEVVQFGVV